MQIAAELRLTRTGRSVKLNSLIIPFHDRVVDNDEDDFEDEEVEDNKDDNEDDDDRIIDQETMYDNTEPLPISTPTRNPPGKITEAKLIDLDKQRWRERLGKPISSTPPPIKK